MRLSLKNPRAHELAAQIAAMTGESLTSVVIGALEERLRTEKIRRGGTGRAGKMLEYAARFASGMPRGLSSTDHARLYSEDGMPRSLRVRSKALKG